MGDLSPGQLVCLSDGRHAILRFIGRTSFAPGDWIGVELNEPTGKNDGSVQGERYFDCEHDFGMFVRPAAVVSILEQPKREERKPVPKGGLNGALQRGRPPSGAAGSGLVPKRQSGLGPTVVRKQSTTSSPSPAPRPGAPGRPLRVGNILNFISSEYSLIRFIVPYKITHKTVVNDLANSHHSFAAVRSRSETQTELERP